MGGAEGDFCWNQLRREYCGVLSLVKKGMIAMLLLSAAFGAMAVVMKDRQKEIAVLAALVTLSLDAILLGAYFVVSDPKCLLRRAPFGQWLLSTGDWRETAQEMDKQIREGYLSPRLALLKNWIIFFESSPTRLDPFRICAYPVAAGDVTSLKLERADRRAGEYRLALRAKGQEYETIISGRDDVPALREWINLQEIGRNA